MRWIKGISMAVDLTPTGCTTRARQMRHHGHGSHPWRGREGELPCNLGNPASVKVVHRRPALYRLLADDVMRQRRALG